MRRILTFGLSLALVLSAAACGDDDPTRPEADLFVGTWVATSMIFSPDGGTPIDVVPFGVSLTAVIDADLDVDWMFSVPGEGTANLTGEVTVNEATNTVTVDFDDPDEESVVAVYTFSQNNTRLTLEADDVEFDIDGDGTEESGSFQVVMQKQ